jgi:hypothetical protein
MKYSEQQLKDWSAYERIRESGLFNMFDPRARDLTTMSSSEWVFCMEHYEDLKQHATQGESK